MGSSGWREEVTTCRQAQERAEWRSASTMPGGLSVTMPLVPLMQQWFADS